MRVADALVSLERRIELAHAEDFVLAGAAVRPSLREICVTGTKRTVEPRVMQMLVALAGAGGAPLSRDDLVARCWDGLAITDDAITQCISKLRRALADLPGVRVETVPRVGYRLVDDSATGANAPAEAAPQPAGGPTGEETSRRRFIGTAATFALTAASGWLLLREISAPGQPAAAIPEEAIPSTPQSREAERLHAAAVRLFRERTRPAYVEAERLLRRAVAIDPSHAPSLARLGMVVYAPGWFATIDDPHARPRLRAEAIGYIRQALAIDRNLAEAHQAMGFVMWDQDPLPWLDRAAALDPADPEIQYQLASILAGRLELRRATALAVRAAELDPTYVRAAANAVFLLHRLGRRREAYRLVDRIEQLAGRAADARRMRFELAYEEGRYADAAILCAQWLARKDSDPWWGRSLLLMLADQLGAHAIRRRLLALDPRLNNVVSPYRDAAESIRLARDAPDEWWDGLYTGARARLLLRSGEAGTLLALYDRRYSDPAIFWDNNRGLAGELAPPLIVAMRSAGRGADAQDLRTRLMADAVKMVEQGDRSFLPQILAASLGALDGNGEAAGNRLERAVDAGWRGQSPGHGLSSEHDPVLAPVRANPAVRRALSRLRESIEVEAAALRQRELPRFT